MAVYSGRKDFMRFFFSPSLFSVPLTFKVFQTVPPPYPHATPSSCPNPRQQPYTQLTGLNKCQKGDFASSTVAFYQKSIFDFLNPFTNLSGYLHL